MKSILIMFVLFAAMVFSLAGCPKADVESGADAGASGATSTPPATQDSQTILGAGDAEPKKCAHCGMDAMKSPAHVRGGGQDFDALSCFVAWAKDNNFDPMEGEIVTYLSAKTTHDFVPIKEAFFVEVESLAMTMPPYIVAFATAEEQAEHANRMDGGAIGVAEALKKAGAEVEGGMHGGAHDSHDGHGH